MKRRERGSSLGTLGELPLLPPSFAATQVQQQKSEREMCQLLKWRHTRTARGSDPEESTSLSRALFGQNNEPGKRGSQQRTQYERPISPPATRVAGGDRATPAAVQQTHRTLCASLSAGPSGERSRVDNKWQMPRRRHARWFGTDNSTRTERDAMRSDSMRYALQGVGCPVICARYCLKRRAILIITNCPTSIRA